MEVARNPSSSGVSIPTLIWQQLWSTV